MAYIEMVERNNFLYFPSFFLHVFSRQSLLQRLGLDAAGIAASAARALRGEPEPAQIPFLA